MRICRMLGCDSGTFYSIKCIFQEKPLIAVPTIFLASVLLFGHALRIAEMYTNSTWYFCINPFWFTFIQAFVSLDIWEHLGFWELYQLLLVRDYHYGNSRLWRLLSKVASWKNCDRTGSNRWSRSSFDLSCYPERQSQQYIKIEKYFLLYSWMIVCRLWDYFEKCQLQRKRQILLSRDWKLGRVSKRVQLMYSLKQPNLRSLLKKEG